MQGGELIKSVNGWQIGTEQVLRLRSFSQEDQKSNSDTALWLCDEIMGAYFTILQHRSNKGVTEGTSLSDKLSGSAVVWPSCTFLDPYFYILVTQGGKRWRAQFEKRSAFESEAVLIPINVDNCHWILGLIRPLARTCVYEPMGLSRKNVEQTLQRWCSEASKSSLQSWIILDAQSDIHTLDGTLPSQTNHYDCGVFVCKAAQAIGAGAKFFCDKFDMAYARRRMLVELVLGIVSDFP